MADIEDINKNKGIRLRQTLTCVYKLLLAPAKWTQEEQLERDARMFRGPLGYFY